MPNLSMKKMMYLVGVSLLRQFFSRTEGISEVDCPSAEMFRISKRRIPRVRKFRILDMSNTKILKSKKLLQ